MSASFENSAFLEQWLLERNEWSAENIIPFHGKYIEVKEPQEHFYVANDNDDSYLRKA